MRVVRSVVCIHRATTRRGLANEINHTQFKPIHLNVSLRPVFNTGLSLKLLKGQTIIQRKI